MNQYEIETTLRQFTAENGGHQTRKYLGMSSISRPESELLDMMLNGSPKPTMEDYQRLALGYETENNVRARLEAAGLIRTQLSDRELVAEWSLHEGQYLFRGHTDGEWIDGALLEIKSTLDEKITQIKRSNKVPRSHFEQVQCYMHFGHYKECRILYFARDTGRIHVERIGYSYGIGTSLNQKARRVLYAYYQTRNIEHQIEDKPF